ncbi:MAG: putative Ig domain-containing protein, partial [Myxococcota bacterium]
MGSWAALFGLLLVACGGSAPVEIDVPEDPDRVLGVNQELPPGIVGEPYEARLEASGGEGSIRFEVAPEARLPVGLVLAPDGTISGIPAEAGTRSTQIIAGDALGQEQRFLATVTIDLIPQLLDCGDVLEGDFTGSAIGSTGPRWPAVTTENLQWLGIRWPQGDNQRVVVSIEAQTTVGLLVQRPNQPEGSLDWREDYVGNWIGQDSGAVVTLDAGTLPSLTGYTGQGIVPILMIAFGESPYRLEVTCSDGPVFRQTLPLPVRLGEDFAIDYDVYGDNSDVTFDIEGDLPAWVTVDTTAGVLSGTAIEEVTVPLVITATTSDGRSREVDSIFGVYNPKPIACGETREITLSEGYYDGPVAGYWDPRGYEVLELAVPSDVSAVSWALDGLDGQYLGLVDHDEDRYFFFGGADGEFSSSGPAELDVTPRSYPATKHYREVGTMYMVAAATGVGRDLTLTVECDPGPRPNLAGLPVVQPLVANDAPLRGIGGTAPYTFAATGLPPGLSVDAGRLVGNTSAVGRHTVDLTITDALAQSYTEAYELYVGLDEGCDGGIRVECNQMVEGSFSGTFFEDPQTRAETRLCFYADGVGAVGFEFTSDGGEYRIDIGDPGIPGSQILDDADNLTYGGVVYEDDTEAVALNPFSWPA